MEKKHRKNLHPQRNRKQMLKRKKLSYVRK